MASPPYEPLSGMDQSFLIFESANTHMHVSAALIFDAKPLRKPDGGIDIDRIRAYTASRLHLIPRYRQRLESGPFDGRPVWVDDAHFNLEYHVRHTSLPRPGEEGQLKRLAARIMSQKLDRAKPLWEIWIVEGLEGDRCAWIGKTHHCMIDGISGVDLLSVMLTPQPNDFIEEAPEFNPRPVPSRWQLIRDEVVRRASMPLDLAWDLGRSIAGADDSSASIGERLRAIAGTIGGFQSPGETPINADIGPHRRFDWVSMDLADVRDVKSQLGGTVNDVVLATVAGAVRRFFEHRGFDTDGDGFRVLTPVSVRTEDQRGTMGNQVSMWLIDLPIGERDAKIRIDQIRDTTAELKETKQALGAKLLTQASEWTGSTLLSLGVQLLHRSLPFNLIVTNVPGPQIKLYLLESELLEGYPVVPLFQGQALGVALFSYAGRLFWGFNGDWDRMPDLSLFGDMIVASFNELRDAAKPLERVRPAPPPARKPTLEA